MVLNEMIKAQTGTRLKALPNPVRLAVFTQEANCRFCSENRHMAEEVAALAPDKVHLEVWNFAADTEKARELNIERVPAIAVLGERDYGIRFYGVPAGFEFTTFVAALELASGRDSGLKPETRERLKALTKPVDLKVFTTLTCPICPLAVNVAHRLAMESDLITASVIDSAEFPELAARHNVMGVPRTIVNDGYSFEGALPEERFVEEVLKGATA
jgi:glutaredoxin-like protein